MLFRSVSLGNLPQLLATSSQRGLAGLQPDAQMLPPQAPKATPLQTQHLLEEALQGPAQERGHQRPHHASWEPLASHRQIWAPAPLTHSRSQPGHFQ